MKVKEGFSMMRVYFDCCCLQRPLDDQTQPRIKVESEVVIALLNTVQAGDIILLNSEALEYEIGRIPLIVNIVVA